MYILASSSPRRKLLMKEISNDFLIDVEKIDEESSYELNYLDAVRDIAKRKGVNVAKRHPDDIVISADTIVVIDGQIIGKPKDQEDAKKILRKLSNRTHEVITAFAIFFKGKMVLNHAISSVTFNYLSDDLINTYVATGSPMDKAGAYGVQDNEQFNIIKNVQGSIENVVGFPTKEIKNTIKELLN